MKRTSINITSSIKSTRTYLEYLLPVYFKWMYKKSKIILAASNTITLLFFLPPSEGDDNTAVFLPDEDVEFLQQITNYIQM